MRNVQLEVPCSFILYLIGNTRAQSLVDLDELPVGEDANVLLLGCGDIRHVLQTAATNDSARSQGGLRKRHLAFHLNDSNDVVLARAALLLLVVSDCDASSDADLDFLWAVWYHLLLTKEQSARLASCLDRLLASSSLSSLGILSVPDVATRARITAVIAEWQVCQAAVSGPVAALVREDRLWQTAGRQYSLDRAHGGAPTARTRHMSSIKEVFSYIAELSWPVSLRVFTDGAGGVGKAHQRAYQLETERWYRAGMSGQALVLSDDPPTGEGLIANVTLMDVGARQWLEHYGSCPFYSYFPLPAEYHPEVGTHPIAMEGRASPSSCNKRNFLHRCCRDVLKGWVVGFQKWTRAERVAVTLWGGDALQLCLYKLYPKPAARSPDRGKTPPQEWVTAREMGGGTAGGGGCRFDAIETSTLADGVGLLNLLLCCAPVLRQHASARLVTGSDLWYTAADTVRAYITAGLGFDERLLPSLLGLRLCTDLQFGTSSAPLVNGLSLREQQLPLSCIERLFEWAPTSLVAGGGARGMPCGITGAVVHLWSRCFELAIGDDRSECRVTSVTTLTFALLLLRLCPLLSRSLPAYSSSRSAVFPDLISSIDKVTSDDKKLFTQGWRAALFLLARAGIGHPLAWDRWLLAAPSRSPTTPAVVLLTGGLMHWDPKSLRAVQPLLKSVTVHVLDSFGVSWDDRCLVFPVPARLGLPERLTIVALATMDTYAIVGEPSLLADCEETTVPGVALESPAERADPLEMAVSLGDGDSLGVSGSSVSGSASTPDAGTPAPAVTVTTLCEHADRYTGVVSFPPGAQGQVRISGRQLEGEEYYEDAAWSAEIAVGSGSAMLRVAWPVVARRANLQVSRNRGTVCFTIPKSAAWPPQGANKRSMEALPPWPRGSTGEKRLELCVQGMFSLQEMVLSMEDISPPEEEADHHLGLRNCLRVMFEWLKRQVPACFVIMDPADNGVPNPKVSVSAQRVREAPGGFPVLEVVCGDLGRTQRLVNEEKIAPEDVLAYSLRILPSRHVVQMLLPEGVIRLLLALLWRGSCLVEPSVWQRSHAEQRPEWVASFLPLVYPEDIPPFQGSVPPSITPRLVAPSKIVTRVIHPQVMEPHCEQDNPAAEKPPPKKPAVMGKADSGTPGVASEAEAFGAAAGLRAKPAGQTSGASKAASSVGNAPGASEGAAADAGNGFSGVATNRGKHAKGAPKACDVCGVVDEKVHRCTACKAAAYCSRECQKRAWPSHKELCKQASAGGRQRSSGK
eukprot:jgi/Mesen1/4895/ME000244S04082